MKCKIGTRVAMAMAVAGLVWISGDQTASAGLVILNTGNPDFADGNMNNGDTATDGSTTLTFGNILNVLGGDFVQVDGDGILLGSFGLTAFSFSIVFDADTVIDEYTIGFNNPFTTGSFQLSGPNGTSGMNNLVPVGTFTFDMGTIPFFAAGQVYTLTHDISGFNGLSRILSFDISAAPSQVPAPAATLLLGGGLLGLGLLGRRTARA